MVEVYETVLQHVLSPSFGGGVIRPITNMFGSFVRRFEDQSLEELRGAITLALVQKKPPTNTERATSS